MYDVKYIFFSIKIIRQFGRTKKILGKNKLRKVLLKNIIFQNSETLDTCRSVPDGLLFA
jgi:hypothetical protein